MDNQEKPKRKTHTSSEVKRRYNAKTYKRFSADIKFELSDRVDAYIQREGISKAQFIANAIDALDK